MKRNKLMEESRKLITPEIKREVDLSFEISDRIYAILQKKGMSQRGLADALNKRESEISKWLSGAHNFTTTTIARIEIALGERIIDITGKQKQIEKQFVFVPVPVNEYYTLITGQKEKPATPCGSEKKEAPIIPIGANWLSLNKKVNLSSYNY